MVHYRQNLLSWPVSFHLESIQMFGSYRTFLAVLVVALHLGGAKKIGAYAVFGFYCLSGYLMTLIMQSTYGYARDGVFRYALNRFLRIYPIYWVSIALSGVLVLWLGSAWTRGYHETIYLPGSAWEIFKNIALFFPAREAPRLTPPAWALTVELFFYILIGAGLSKSKLITTGWFVISLAYHGAALILHFGWEHRYFTVAAAALPFSTGAMIYHFKDQLGQLVAYEGRGWKRYLPVYGVILMIVNWAVGIGLWKFLGWNALDSVFFYLNYLICGSMVVLLMQRTELPLINRAIDKWLGDFSYPIYLIHYQVGILVLVLLGAFGVSISRPSPLLFIAALPFIFLISFVITVLLERPIEVIRARVKS